MSIHVTSASHMRGVQRYDENKPGDAGEMPAHPASFLPQPRILTHLSGACYASNVVSPHRTDNVHQTITIATCVAS